MTGITRQQAALAVGELFQAQPYYIGTYYETWGVQDHEGKEWKFTYDGSIHTQRRVGNNYTYANDEYSTEMVSPKLSYQEMENCRALCGVCAVLGQKLTPPVVCMFMWMRPTIHPEV